MNRIAATLALVCLASPVAAQTRQDLLDRCEGQDHDIAIGACTRLIQSGKEPDINLVIIFNNRGSSYSQKNDLGRALQDFETALRLDPAYIPAYYNRALLYLRSNDFGRALRDADRIHQVQPGSNLPYGLRGEVLRLQGRFVEATQQFDKALSPPPNEPGAERSFRSRRAASEQARRCGDVNADLSIAACNAIIGDKYMTKEALASAFHWRGFAHFSNGNDVQAINDYSEAIRLGVPGALIFSNRGIANTWAGRYEDAAKDFERSLSMAPNSAATINGQGLLARQQGDHVRALERFTTALGMSPRNASYSSNRGITYLLMERYDDALIDLNNAISIDPKDAFPLFARGVVKRRQGDSPGGDADIAAAKAMESGVEAAMAKRNVKI